MRCTGVLLPVVLLVAVLLTQVTTGRCQDVVEAGKAIVVQGLAKAKEIFDHGVSVKSDGKHSFDFFGIKLGTNQGFNTGFGDAANGDAAENNDDLERRRKRSLNVLEAIKEAGLLASSALGTNINIIKISSVSNVNFPVNGSEAKRRRKRSPLVYQKSNVEKKTITVDNDNAPAGASRTHEVAQYVRGSVQTLVSPEKRAKRSPQDQTASTTESSNGPPRGGPPHGGGRPGGPPRGPPPGCHGGSPPPPPPNATAESATEASARRKRSAEDEVSAMKSALPGDNTHGGFRSVVKAPIRLVRQQERKKRSPRGCGGRGKSTTPPPGDDLRKKRNARTTTLNYASDYSDGDYSDSGSSEEAIKVGMGVARRPRQKRQAPRSAEIPGKVGSWLEQIAGVFVETARKVVSVTKGAFGAGRSVERDP